MRSKRLLKKKTFFIPSAEAIALQQEEYRYEKVWFQILCPLCLSYWQIISLSCKKEKSGLGLNGEIFEMICPQYYPTHVPFQSSRALFFSYFRF